MGIALTSDCFHGGWYGLVRRLGRIARSWDVARQPAVAQAVRNAEDGTAGSLFDHQLCAACDTAVSQSAPPGSTVTLSCIVAGEFCEPQRTFVIEMAARLVRHAVRWGMVLHLIGRVAVQVQVQNEVVTLSVIDDGWGCRAGPAARREMAAIVALAAADDAVVCEDTDWSETVTMLRVSARR